MKTQSFTTSINDYCKPQNMPLDCISVSRVLEMANPKHKQGNHIIIARYRWLRFNELPMPEDMELPNLCITIKNGKPERAFYDNRLSHIIKKQKYTIQILN
jgi:hypothetical protein